MINLLSPQVKRQIRAARTNVILRNYCMLLLLTAALLAGVFGVGWWVTTNDKLAAEQSKAQSQQASAEYAVTRQAAQDFAKDLAVAKTILASNVSFSTLLTDIAAIIPKGVILNNLSLTAASPTAPVDISGRASSYTAAITLKNSLEESSIFENVSITSINQADTTTLSQADSVTQKYPFTVNLKVKFSKTTQKAATQ